MIVTYLRSSGFNTHEWCPHQFFMSYVLGYHGPGNLKADKGTIVHKILEVLAKCKLAQQENKDVIDDEIFCENGLDGKDITIDVMSDIESLSNRAYRYYSTRMTHHKWTSIDQQDCYKWACKAIAYNDGEYNPQNRVILSPEKHFDIEFKQPWAKYQYVLDGKIVEGQFAIKGTIDLVTQYDKSTIEFIDWKTGRRWNWGKDSEKNYETLRNDPQLRLYHYALSKIYPEYENIICTIFYINAGGPIAIPFHKKDIVKTEGMIKEKFLEIQQDELPRLDKTWKCGKLCYFGKTKWPGTKLTMCEAMHGQLVKKGMQPTVDKYRNKQYNIDQYRNPGSI